MLAPGIGCKESPIKTNTKEIKLNANTTIQETSKNYSRFKLSWNLFWFRFAAGRGKPAAAQRFLNRIPLPDTAVDKAAFQAQEKKLWREYVDQDGNIRLITWATILAFLVKALIGMAVVAALIWGAYYLTNTFIYLKAKSVHPFQPDAITGKEFQLIDRETMVVDIRHRPIFSNRSLYLPVFIFKGNKTSLFYIPDKKFTGELIPLADGSLARKFILADGSTLSYVYHPKSIGTKGKWLDQSQLARLKAAAGSGNLFFVRKGGAAELRSKPREKAKSILEIPDQERIIFVGFAPISSISSKFVWAQVRYLAGPGKDHQGWLAAVSIGQPFVDAESDSNMLKVAAQTLDFRKAPSTKAARIPGVNRLKKGTRVEFLEFAPLADILSSTYAGIQVKYIHKPGKDYTGWIFAGKIRERFIGKIKKELGKKKNE